MLQNLAVIGAGAWGTALASVGVRAGLRTILWAREPEVVDAVNATGENSVFLKGHNLPEGLEATGNMADAARADIIFLVSPAQHMRATVTALKPHVRAGVPLVICSKGIEAESGLLLSDVLAELMPGHPVVVLSGPTFAAEVADNLPCALTIAAKDKALVESLANALSLPTFRLYGSEDIHGAQIGGAIKNVLAIATGMVAGLDMGENTRAAVITRGLAEMMRFGAAFGARQETLMGLSGLGDLILTCGSTQSRNMSLGAALGQGQSLEDVMARRNSVAEGVHTAAVVHRIANERAIDMPIASAVYDILYRKMEPRKAAEQLLARPFAWENA